MQTYYELMHIVRREKSDDEIRPGVKRLIMQEEFNNGDEIDELAQEMGIDSESETVATAIGIIRWLLKNDESVNGKYVLKKKK